MTKRTLLTILSFIGIGVVTRTVAHIAPNFEFVTALTLTAAALLPRRFAWIVPVAIMFLSDMIIGNTNIYLFTWSGFLFTYFLGMFNKHEQFSFTQLGRMTGLGLISVLFFYFWTNLGVVILSSMYPLTLAGYGQSLMMALPFLKIQLWSALITVPMVYGIYQLSKFDLHAFSRYSENS